MNEALLIETPPRKEEHTITGAILALWAEPRVFVRNWNYKGAILSGVLRAPIFLITYLIKKEAIWLAVSAALVQFVFRFFFAGVGGTLIQSFRFVEPPWKALAAVLLVVPAISHLFEFLLQLLFGHFTGTREITGEAILRSVCVSLISALFTLFAMRRGIMIVGDSESKSLMSDISRLPVIIFEFVAFIPIELSHMIRRGAFLGAGLAIVVFGIFSEILVWAVTNRLFWTYNYGKDLGWFKYWGVDGLALMIIAVMISLVATAPRHKHL